MDSLRISLILLGAGCILVFYLWERFKRNRQDDRYERWGGVNEEGTETHVVSPQRNPDLHDDDVADIDSIPEHYSSVEPQAEDEDFYTEAPDLDSDPELMVDPIPDIRSELEALEEIISIDDEEPDQIELGDLDIRTESRNEHIDVPQEAEAAEPERIIALHVMSQEGERFNGFDLLQAFTNTGLQYGEMDIFHRMQEGSDVPVFSLANAVEPGTFDPEAMEETNTPALLIIMTLPHRMDALEVFDDMLDTARKISEELNGRLCDDHRSVLTRQAIDDLRASLSRYTLNKSLSEQSA